MLFIVHRRENHHDFDRLSVILERVHVFTGPQAVMRRFVWSEEQFVQTRRPPLGYRHMVDGVFHWFAACEEVPLHDVRSAEAPWELRVHPGDGDGEAVNRRFPRGVSREELSWALNNLGAS
ncbi:hypothetical protein AB0O47_39785 [Streptomyces noursei]|uniref:hypothetical protein n=1 Tax=Streptomyces noursei TaxID=1971 RepID=UPI00344DDD0C